MARRVRTPTGGEWVIRRRWIDRTRKWYGYDWATSGTDEHWGGRRFVFPMLAFYAVMRMADLVASTAGHLLGAPWTIEAKLDAIRKERLTWRVRGWSESKRALDEAATALSHGHTVTSFGEPERDIP